MKVIPLKTLGDVDSENLLIRLYNKYKNFINYMFKVQSGTAPCVISLYWENALYSGLTLSMDITLQMAILATVTNFCFVHNGGVISVIIVAGLYSGLALLRDVTLHTTMLATVTNCCLITQWWCHQCYGIWALQRPGIVKVCHTPHDTVFNSHQGFLGNAKGAVMFKPSLAW
jgi:hypothetical protein